MKRIFGLGFLTSVLALPTAGADELEEIIVRAEASVVASTKTVGSGSTINAKTLELVRANHVHAALVRLPGVWVSRGSGQEHLTAIRSGVLTGPGACGGSFSWKTVFRSGQPDSATSTIYSRSTVNRHRRSKLSADRRVHDSAATRCMA